MTIVQAPFIVPNDPIILKKLVRNNYQYIHIDAEEGRLDINGLKPRHYFRIYFWRCGDKYLLTTPIEERGAGFNNGYSIFVDLEGEGCVDIRSYDMYAGELNFQLQEELKGIGLGSIVLNHLLFWAKEHYEDFNLISRVRLEKIDETPDNTDRRNRFWSRPGLVKIDKNNKVTHKAQMPCELSPVIEKRGFEIFRGVDYSNLAYKIEKDLNNRKRKQEESDRRSGFLEYADLSPILVFNGSG